MFLARKNSFSIFGPPMRCFSTQTNIGNCDEKIFKDSWKNAKSYESIPGPSKFDLIIGSLPGGRFSKTTYPDLLKILRQEHGNIYKIKGLFGKRDLVILYDPKDFEIIFRTEGNFPIRRGFDTFAYFRKVHRKQDYKTTTGLLNEQGEDWWNLRHKVNPVMMKPQVQIGYISAVDEVTMDFMKKLHILRDTNQETPANFLSYINIWALEAISCITMNMRLGLLADKPDESVLKIMDNLKSVFDNITKLDFELSIWKIVKTPTFNRHMSAMDELHDAIGKFIEQSMNNFKKKEWNSQNSIKEFSVLEKLYNIDKGIAFVMVLDSIHAGVDTTSGTAFGTLYHLATNPDKQEILRSELKEIFPQKDTPLTKENMNKMPYLRACIKESIRLMPVFVDNMRTTGQNVVIKGYQIPKFTDIIMYNKVLHMDKSYFPNPKAFIPERWLRSATEKSEIVNPFAYLPFGFGSRACIGKRFAELEVESLVIRMILNYQLEWHHPPPEMKLTAIYLPTGDLKLKMKEL